MKKSIGKSAAVVSAAALAALLATGVGLAGSPGATDGGTAASGIDTTSAIVQLAGEPLSTYPKTKPPSGKKIDFGNTNVKSYRAYLNNLRNDFKKWLSKNAPEVKTTGEYDISLNAVAVNLNGASLATLRAAPMVVNVQYEAVYTPQAHDDPDLALVHANQAWTAGAKGSGVKVAIIDTGIDIGHPCFSDGAPGNDGPYTNDRVIFAGVFNNKAKVNGYTPADEQGHGTHVAGTVACNEHTPVIGFSIPYDPSGVAPLAQLGNFNVFPAAVDNARSEDILNALESAYAQGYDVVNMSLGGTHGKSGNVGFQDLLMNAVDDLDQAGMVSAVAAGNSGPGFNTVESPGAAARALTAGAITVGHFIGVNVTDNDEAVDYAAAIGQFGPSSAVTGPLSANLGTYCTGGGSHIGEIALINRGACTFSTKIRNAETAGAIGVIIGNNVPGPPISMAQDGTPSQPTIPGVMVSYPDGNTLASKSGHSFTIDDTQAYVYSSTGDNVLAGFSSHGPTDVDYRVKPDVVAPGVNVLSSQPASVCGGDPNCWAFFQGTSMATPHLAGIAALVKGAHPTWSAGATRSAIVNTADYGVINLSGFLAGGQVNATGAGRANAQKAIAADVALDQVSVSFGAVPSGSGRADTRLVSLTTLDTAAASAGVVFESCSGSGVDFGAALSGNTITVTMVADKGIASGNCQGILRVYDAGGNVIAHAAVYAFIK